MCFYLMLTQLALLHVLYIAAMDAGYVQVHVAGHTNKKNTTSDMCTVVISTDTHSKP